MKLLFREQAGAQSFGDGPVHFQWRPGGNNIAVGGTSGLVRIYSRYGEVVEEFSINESVAFVKWDSEGELLAVVTAATPAGGTVSSSAMVLYEFSANNVHTIDFSMGAKTFPTLVVWSPTQPLLLVGDSRGNIVLFNHRTSRKVPIMGKHQKAIRTGDFSHNGQLFGLGSEDQTITINSTENGDTLNTFSCNGVIECFQFTRFRRMDARAGSGNGEKGDKEEDFISAIIGHRNLMIVRLNEPENPSNLQFQERYGNILRINWFGNGSLLVGFEKGFIVCLSAEKASEISQEVFSIQEYKSHLAYFSINVPMKKLYSIGDNLLKIRELHDLNEVSDLVDVDSEDKGLVQVSASQDGSLTAVSGKSGSFSIYLTTLPIMAAAYQSCIGVLSSLTEVTIYKDGDLQPCLTMNVKVEPSMLAIGPKHVAVVLNNRAWFYEISKNSYNLVYEHEYLTTVSKLRLNREYVMAKLDGKVHLHKIPESQQRDEGEGEAVLDWMDSRIFPDSNELSVGEQHASNQLPESQGICDAELSEKFLIYATKDKYIYYFSLAYQSTVSDYKHSCQTKAIFVEDQGVRICFIDERHDAYVYTVDDCLSKIPQIGALLHYKSCLWETFTIDRDSFVVHDGSSIYVFVVSKNIRKPEEERTLNHICTLAIPYGNIPLMLSKGIVYCHTHNGRVNTILLKSHKTDTVFEGKSHSELREMLIASLTLKRWRNAWRICDHLKEKESWQLFSKAALEDMNIDLAIRIFRFIGDVGMVWRLEELLYTEEALTLAGHVTALLGTDFDSADELFCRSKEPRNALDMRRDIQQWDRALELAKKTAPEELSIISKEYAMQLEFLGKHEEALRHYEHALIDKEVGEGKPVTPGFSSLEEEEEHNWVCKGGIARMALRAGDLRRGVQTALAIPGRIAKRDCGLILEQMRQFDEAGRLYEAGLFYDRAVASFLRCKNWVKVNELIEKVRSPKILSQYGKILAGEKKYDQAFEVYSKARDYDNMIGLLLKHLNRPEEAVRLAQESRSIEGARMVAKFFTELGNNESAIKFLVLSQCYQEAYELAEICDRMDVYADALESADNATTNAGQTTANHSQLFAQLADYYTLQRPNLLMAGRFAGLAKNFSMALDNLMQVNSGRLKNTTFTAEEEDTAARLAVEFAAQSEERNLVYKLIDYLLGETDGVPKNPKYLFQFYVKLKMYPEAAKTAIIIAQDQQSKGYYKTAHDLLFGMHRTLRTQKIRIPAEMENNLQLLHSYNITRSSYFARAEVALPGAALFFGKQSVDERQHAQKLIDYQCSRGGKVVYMDLKAPAKQQWSSLLMAIQDALEMEKNNNKALLELHELGSSKKDPDFTNFLEGFYLPEQVVEIDQLTRLANQLQLMGVTNFGVQLFDQQLLQKVNIQHVINKAWVCMILSVTVVSSAGLIKRGENYIAAQLLIRISTNISQFPIHAVPILTSTAVTCAKAGLKASAFKFASLLLQPTYRDKIDEKYKRKIETVVRKSDRNSTDVEMKRTPCPMCQTPVEEFNLSCSECKSSIPYCVVTGKHVTSSDFAMCPSCSFPGFFSEFKKLAILRENCPMCYETVDSVVQADPLEVQKCLQEK